MGTHIAPLEYTVFRVDREKMQVVEKNETMYGRKISLLDIRQKLLRRHDELGIIRYPYLNVSTEQSTKLVDYLTSIQVDCDINTPRATLESLAAKALTTRFFKVWHDHGKIAGHGHLLVTVATIYDPACILPDLQRNEGEGETDGCTIHCWATRNWSTCSRRIIWCGAISVLPSLTVLCQSNERVKLFIRRDTHQWCFTLFSRRPSSSTAWSRAQQRRKLPTCSEANVSLFDDLSYCFRSQIRSIDDRHTFIKAGKVWKDNTQKPFDNLSVQSLRQELQSWAIDINGKLRFELDKIMESLRIGINSFPALTQPNPAASLQELNLEQYEISVVEPLHDFKGHMSNLFQELPTLLSGNAATEVDKIKQSILSRDTLRCVDYRRATSLALEDSSVSDEIKMLADTAVEICAILYAKDDHEPLCDYTTSLSFTECFAPSFFKQPNTFQNEICLVCISIHLSPTVPWPTKWSVYAP